MGPSSCLGETREGGEYLGMQIDREGRATVAQGRASDKQSQSICHAAYCHRGAVACNEGI